MTLPAPHEKAAAVRAMFARIALRYDLMNHLMTFGCDRSWQREVVEHIIKNEMGSIAAISKSIPMND